MSSRVLETYEETLKNESCCYRKRSAKEDEAYSILCELCIPDRGGRTLTLYRDMDEEDADLTTMDTFIL